MAVKQHHTLLLVAGAIGVLYLMSKSQSAGGLGSGTAAAGGQYGGGWGGTPGGYFGTGNRGTNWVNTLPVDWGGSPMGSPPGSPAGTAPGTTGTA